MECVKCVFVGDSAVGKTCMLISYKTGSFPTDFVPQVDDNYHEDFPISDGHRVSLGLFDTAGQDEYYRTRPLRYPKTDVFIICYSISSPTSLENVGKKWLPEIRQHCRDFRFLLVGTQSDLRKDARALEKLEAEGGSLVDLARAEEQGKKLGAARVMECSAKTQACLKDVLEEAVKVALAPRPSESESKCCVLL